MNYQQYLVKLRQMFGIFPAAVSLPVPMLKQGKDSNRICVGYSVHLRYPNNKRVACDFECGENTPHRSACDIAHDAAMQFYREQQEKARGTKMKQKIDFKQVFDTVKYKLQHAFNWEISGVNAPVARVDSRGNVLGWTVEIIYKHHGAKKYVFDIHDERLWTTYKDPQAAARELYDMYFRIMQKQQAKKLALQR